MSSLFDRCTPFRSYCTGSDIPHLSAVLGVWDLLGAPKSDGGCGEVESRCRPPRGLESSMHIVSDRCWTYGWMTLALGVSDTSGRWGSAMGFQFLVTNSLGYPFILNTWVTRFFCLVWEVHADPVCSSKQGPGHCCLVSQRVV